MAFTPLQMQLYSNRFQGKAPQNNFEKAIQLSAGNPSEFKAQFAAVNDGFKSVDDRAVNRLLRDNFETKLQGLGITDYNAAYSQLSGGRPLTSNATLFDMINNVGSVAPQENKKVDGGDAGSGNGNNTGSTIGDYEDGNKGYEDLLSQIGDMFPDPMQAVGGPGSSLDGGATGFRRKRSSGRMAGLTNKGTSQLKITGQNTKSSGLNIG